MNLTHIFDTNTLIYFMDGALTPKGLDFVLNSLQSQHGSISVISKIETLGFPFPNELQASKADQLINSLPIFSLTDDIVNKTIEIRKNNRIKVADAIIAATALINDLELVSRNEKDFKNLSGLSLVNPFSL